MPETQDIRTLINKLDKGELPQNVLVFGEETFFIDKLFENLKNLQRRNQSLLQRFLRTITS